MKITELIKNRARKFLGIGDGAQRMYESDLENLRTYQVMENRVYYIGDSNKIRWFYTKSQWAGIIANNPLYNMNRRNYFSTIVANEQAKMVHSGLPRAIVDTMCAVMGMPTVSVEGIDSEELDRLRKETKVDRIIYKQQMPLTLAEGWGALKVNMSTKYKKYPTLEFYEAKDVVATGLRHLYRTRKDVSIHGLPVRLQVGMVKLVPHRIVMKIWLNQQKKPKNNKGLTTK